MKKNFSILLCFVLLLFSSKALSQESFTEKEGFEGKNLVSKHADADWFKMMSSAQPNLFEIQKAYDAYFTAHPFEKSKETRAFEFWKKHVVRDNYDAQGFVGKQNVNYDDLQKLSTRMKAKGAATVDNWTRVVIKPDMLPDWQSGSYTQGTCNMIAINPTNSNEMIAAFIDGGTLWRTTDNCATWNQVATNLLVRNFGSVVYSKSNPLIVYAGSSQGVIKSTDGGATWAMTAYDQRASYPGGNDIWAMEVKADDPNTVLFGVSNQLYKTTNGGTSWTNVTFGGGVRDIRALPSTANIVLATVKNGSWYEVRRSTDFGTTWTSITNGYPASITGYTGELATMAVSAAAPNNVWVHLMCKQTSTGTTKTYDIYKSTDGGVSFARMNVSTDISENFWQGGWNEAFAVSDTDPNLMASGSYSMWVSTNGGTTWTGNGSMGKTGPHSDVHGIVIKGTSIWSAGDGGIYKSTDNGVSYNHNVDDGIQSHCLWGFDQGWKNDIMALGMYHGPTTIRDDAVYTGWYPGPGADAGVAFVNKGDDRYIYAHPWGNTRVTRSTARMTPPSNTAISYVSNGINDMNDPNYYEKLYGSNGSKIMVSSNNANSFDNSFSFESNITDYIVALTDNNIIYARGGNTIKKSTDGGISWVDVSPTSIISGQSISHIAVDGENPLVIWVTFGGKQSTIKVGKSTDGGATWSNYSSTGLPSYSVNCIVSQMGANGAVYIGTDAGVYYRNNSLSTWVAYNANLPLATHVGWIKINYAKAKLRIAGQTGIWESDLYSASTPVAHPTTPVFENQVGKAIQFADMSVCLANATYSWSFPGGTPSTSTLERPTVTYSAGGDKNVTLTVTDANGTSTKTYTNFIRVRTVGDVAKTGWTVTYYDSQETTNENTPATFAIDGNYNTIWGTNWSSTNPPYPHEIRIDMGATQAIESFKYQGAISNSNGDVKGYEWYVSNDGTNWGTAVATGDFSAAHDEKTVTLSEPVTGRYFKFIATSQQTGTNWCKASEIGIKGSTSVISAFTANKTLALPGGSIAFTDRSAGSPTSWSWSFPGGTPSTSTAQNPTVVYATAGIYPVTLQVTSASGTDIVTKNSYITVSTFVPQTGWSVKYFDSQETSSENTPAVNAIDGSNSTFWGTDWSTTNPACPHEIQIDMGTNYLVNGFNYVPRQNSSNGRIANYEFYVSSDGINWGTATNTGTWANDAVEKSLNFSTVSARYFKLKALSEVNGNNWTTVAEIKMKMADGIPPVTDFNTTATAITTGQSVTFTDLSTNTPTSWNWTFTGGSPATSTSQNPTVTYNTAGTYTVALTATNAAGNNTKTKTGYITVTAAPTYCSSQSTNFTNDYIKTVAIGSFTNTTTGSTYSNYTASVIPLTLGTSTSYTLTPKGTTRTEYWRVYIDYNHDGSFTADELVINVNGKTAKTGTFTVLSTAPTGQTRMRVMQKYNAALTSACEAFTYGEVEDYTVNITGYKPVVAAVVEPIAEEATIYSYANEIKVSLGEGQKARVLVYDAIGRQVIDENIASGLNSLSVYNKGIYIVKVQVNNKVISRKVVIE